MLLKVLAFSYLAVVSAAYFVPISTEFMGNKAHWAKSLDDNSTEQEIQVLTSLVNFNS